MIAPPTRLRTVSRLALAMSLWGAVSVGAAEAPDDFAPALAALERASGGKAEVTRSSRTGLVTFLSIRNGVGGGAGELEGIAPVSPEASARAFVNSYGRLFGLRDASQLLATRTSPRDAVGMDHVRFQQVEQGVPVTGAELVVHLKGSRVVAMNGKALRLPVVFDVVPTFGADRARATAASYMDKRLKVSDAALSEPRLEVFDLGLIGGAPRPTRLAWFVEASRIDARRFFWIDAHNGAILKHFSQLTHALNRKVYNANHGSALPGTLVRSEGQGAAGDVDVNRAYDYSGDTYNYYKNKHNRDSFDGAGGQLKSTVHYCPSPAAEDCPYENAFWNGAQMVYGDGFPAADDVDAHELTHAVTERTAGLFYYMQSGALNESFSDIFGETVDQTNGHGTDTPAVKWKIGEDVPIFGALRDMMDPTVFDDPGKVSDPDYKCELYPWYNDSGGVHSNSGVPNHAYALMVDGGTYNGHTITGIGFDKAGAIEYRALTEYLSTASNFRDDYDALLNSCLDLVGGTLGITSGNCDEVQEALDAVEMTGDQPCDPEQASVPDQCPVGTLPVSAFADDFESTTSGNWSTSVLANGSVWTGGTGTPAIYHPDFAFGGTFSLWGFDPDVVTDSTVNMAKSVLIPQHGLLYFDHSHGFEWDPAPLDGSNGLYDGGVIEYSVNNGASWTPIQESWFSGGDSYDGTIYNGYGNPLGGRRAFVRESWGYTASKLDISALAGQNARFRFRVGSDDTAANFGWFIDDVRIYSCDVGGTVRLSAATYSVGEAGPTVTITVTRSGGGAPGVSIDYATSSGTATEGEDYTGRSGTLTFGSGVTSRTFTVPITNDALTEGNETFDVTLSNPQGASLVLGSPAAAVVTIVDDDLPGTVQFSAATATVSEASTFATITVKRTGGVAGGVTVQYAAANGSATAGSDFTPASGTLTFGAGVTSQTFQVPIANDALDEANETVNLALSAPGGGASLGVPSAAVLTITDNDTAGAIQFSAASYSASEAVGGAVITVSRSGGAASGVTVHYATSDGTATSADYTGIGGTLSFDAGQTTKTIIVPIANDDLGENNETVRLSLTSPTGGATLGARATAVLTIVENETVMQLSAPQYGVAENVSKVTLTVKRSGNLAGASSVHYSLVDATALAGSDYTLATGTLAFAANTTSKTFTVTILNDVVSEAPEFFVVKLDAPVGGVLGPQDTATVLVTDDDAVLALSAATYTVAETTATVTITVKRSGNRAGAATVHYDTSSGTASEPDDSPGAHGVLNFAVNAASATFKVPIVNDGESEGSETLNIALSGPTGARLGLSAAVLTITDDEPVVTLTSAAYSVAESAASATITVRRNGPTTSTATVHYATSDGTATAGSDYAAVGNTLTFNPGVRQLTFTIPILPDTSGEPSETVNIALSSPTGASLGIAAAVLTITDNDPSIAFSAATYTVKESRTATITVKRTGATTAPASVHYETSPGSATADSDYTTTAGTLNLGVGKASATFTVPILNDTMDEGAETVLLTLSSPTGGVLGLASATLQIDDDDAATAVKLGASSYSGSESRGAVTLTLARTGASGIPVTVTYATADVTAVAGTDYLGVSDSVTFAAGETLKVIEIPLFTNGAGSPAKSFTVTLLDPTNGATLAAPQSATVFITP
jgi:Zn-dependent metalloprotease